MRKTALTLALSTACAVGGAADVLAQALPTSQPKYMNIIREQEKLGRSADHAKHEAGWPAAYEKAKGTQTYLALTAMTGSPEVWYITPFESHAALDQATRAEQADSVLSAELDRLQKADADYLADWRSWQAAARPDLSYGSFPNVGKVRFYEISVFQVKPGYEGGFAGVAKAYAAAAGRSAPKAAWRVYEVMAGAPGGTFIVLSSLESFGEFDQMMTDGMSMMKSFTAEETIAMQKFNTDGLVERRDQPLPAGSRAELRAALGARAGPGVLDAQDAGAVQGPGQEARPALTSAFPARRELPSARASERRPGPPRARPGRGYHPRSRLRPLGNGETMALTRAELIQSLQHEVKILLHLASKVESAALDYRPSPKQRSTLELLRYLAMMGPALLDVARTGIFDGAAWTVRERATDGLDFDQAVAAIAAQREAYARLADLSDADLRGEIAPWGETSSRGSFIVNFVLGGHAAYRMQLFLYLKACGRHELGTSNLWDGADPPPKKSLDQLALDLLLALEAARGPGHGLQALGLDGLAALAAGPEVAVGDAGQRLLHELELLPLGLGQAEDELAGVGAGGAVALVLHAGFRGLSSLLAALPVRFEDLVLLALEGLRHGGEAWVLLHAGATSIS